MKNLLIALTVSLCLLGSFPATAKECPIGTSIAEFHDVAVQNKITEEVLRGDYLKEFENLVGSPSVDYDTVVIYILPDAPVSVATAFSQGCAVAQGQLPADLVKAFIEKHRASSSGEKNG